MLQANHFGDSPLRSTITLKLQERTCAGILLVGGPVVHGARLAAREGIHAVFCGARALGASAHVLEGVLEVLARILLVDAGQVVALSGLRLCLGLLLQSCQLRFNPTEARLVQTRTAS